MKFTSALFAILLVSPSALSAATDNSPVGQSVWALLRAGANHPCAPGALCDPGAGLADRPEIAPTDPLFGRVAGLISRGCGLSGEPPPPVPRGRLVWWDIDGDGQRELVFGGGCSPEPYFVVLQGSGDAWRVAREFRGRLLSISKRGQRVIFLAAMDGYGVERDNVLSLQICPSQAGGSCSEVAFRWPGELQGLASTGGATGCTTLRVADLRSEPRVDDAPEESGMGFDWPGNLTQRLAKGSSGWQLETARAPDGTSWALCAFPAPPPPPEGQELKSLTAPALVRRTPLPGALPRTELLLGWIERAALNTK